MDRTAVSPRRQFGLIWGGVAAALVALSPFAQKLAAALPACPVKTLAGIPCPGCGTGRAALALAGLDLGGAFTVSPLAAAGWVALVAGGLATGAVSLLGIDPPEPPARLPVWARAAAVAVLLANWAYLIWSGG